MSILFPVKIKLNNILKQPIIINWVNCDKQFLFLSRFFCVFKKKNGLLESIEYS